MSLEKITAANHVNWKKEYLGRPINQRLAKKTHWLMKHLYNPKVGFVNGADAKIKELSPDIPWMVVGAHTSDHDSDAFAASVERFPFLRDKLTARTHPMGKPGLLNSKIGRYFRAMGVLPGFRDVDAKSQAGSSKLTDDQKRDQSGASKAGTDIGTDWLMKGENILVYGEGTRNKEDVLKIQRIKRGPARMACQAYAEGTDVAIIPFVSHYNNGHKNIRSWQWRKARNAYVQFGEPIVINREYMGDTGPDRLIPNQERQDQITESIHDSLELCLSGAIQAASQVDRIAYCE